jgi:hypothetical protein
MRPPGLYGGGLGDEQPGAADGPRQVMCQVPVGRLAILSSGVHAQGRHGDAVAQGKAAQGQW